MAKVVMKFLGGLLLGIGLFALVRINQDVTAGQGLLYVVWGIGIVGGFSEYVSWMSSALNTSVKVGFLAWLSFGSGMIGMILLVCLFVFVLMFGWIYGWIRLIKELISVL